MSKCDVSIHFDRPERTYRGGEPVTGYVDVSVNQDVNSNGVVLEHFWRTHGSGNTASGNKTELQLYSGPLTAGESLQLPFEVTAPHGPPTYRGHHLNVDHYLKARVDIPWAFDPKQEEEYLLLGSGEPYAELPKQTDAVSKKGCEQFGALVGAGMLVAGILFIFPFGLVLIPGGLVILFFSLRRKMAEKRLGPVQVDWGGRVLSPGGTVPLRLSFTPNKSIQINAIHLKLAVAEECTSGSGTNTTTHTHKLHDESQTVAAMQTFPAHQPVEIDTVITLPDLPAYSFEASDNRLYWRAELRIELPLWPDWIDKRDLVVLPPPLSAALDETDREPSSTAWEGLTANIASEPTREEVVEAEITETVATHQPPAAEPYTAAETAPLEPVVIAGTPSTTLPLVEMLDSIIAEGRYSQERERIAERASGESFACPLDVRRTERTYAYDAQPPYRDGRTVHGHVAGTEHEVSVWITADRNDEVDRLASGNRFECQATPIKWNSLYDRLEMREA